MSTAKAATPASAAAKTPPKKGLNLVLVLVPVAIIAALGLAFLLPPSHALIVNGPLKPLFTRLGMAGPTTVAGKGVKPLDPAAEAKRLGDQLDAAQKAGAQKDARITQLQAQVAGLQAPVSDSSPTPVPKPSPTAVSNEIKRVATYWSGMDAEKAAELAQQLPQSYVRSVFSAMSPDAVAEIMNAMPAKIGAKLTADANAEAP